MRIQWDEIGKHMFITGADHCVLYLNSGGDYLNGVPWNGLIAYEPGSSGRNVDALYTKDFKVGCTMEEEELDGTIRGYTYPDEFEQCLGYDEAFAGVYFGQQDSSVFGICYRTLIGNDIDGADHGYELHLVYGLIVKGASCSYASIAEQITAAEMSWNVECVMPIAFDYGKPVSEIVIKSTKAKPETMAMLEDILYGTEDTSPRLPSADELYGILYDIAYPMVSYDLPHVVKFEDLVAMYAGNSEFKVLAEISPAVRRATFGGPSPEVVAKFVQHFVNGSDHTYAEDGYSETRPGIDIVTCGNNLWGGAIMRKEILDVGVEDIIDNTDKKYLRIGPDHNKKWLTGMRFDPEKQYTIVAAIERSDGVNEAGIRVGYEDGTYDTIGFMIAPRPGHKVTTAFLTGTHVAGIFAETGEYVALRDRTPYKFRQSIAGGKVYEDMLVGGSVVWNQLVDKSQYEGSKTESGITFTNNDDGSVTVTGTASETAVYTADGIPVAERPSGHKYLVLTGNGETGSSTTFELQLFRWSATSTANKNADVYSDTIITKENDNEYTAQVRIVIRSGTTVNNLVFKPQIIDLTAMFGTTIADYMYNLEQQTVGSGVALFKSLFPDDYYPYSAPTIKSVEGVSARVTTGFNQWDEELELGTYSSAYGSPMSSSTRMRTVNPIRILPGVTYYAKSSKTLGLRFYDANGAFCGESANTTVINARFTTPNNAHYLRFTVVDTTVYNHDICINISDTNKNGLYEPYEERRYPLDSSLTLLGIPKLLNDEIYFDGDTYTPDGTVTRKYDVVDLGTLNWSVYSNDDTGHSFFAYTPSDCKRCSEATVANDICVNYVVTNFMNITQWKAKDKSMCQVSLRRIIIRDTFYADAATFKTAMSGVMLVYEVEDPITKRATPYTALQFTDAAGTEEYVTTGLVPVGHSTRYLSTNNYVKLYYDECGIFEGDIGLEDFEPFNGTIHHSTFALTSKYEDTSFDGHITHGYFDTMNGIVDRRSLTTKWIIDPDRTDFMNNWHGENGIFYKDEPYMFNTAIKVGGLFAADFYKTGIWVSTKEDLASIIDTYFGVDDRTISLQKMSMEEAEPYNAVGETEHYTLEDTDCYIQVGNLYGCHKINSVVAEIKPFQKLVNARETSPSNVRQIFGYTDCSLVCSGKNLFGGTYMRDLLLANTTGAVIQEDGSIKIGAVNMITVRISPFNFKPNTAYTIILTVAKSNTSNGTNVAVQYTDGTYTAIAIGSGSVVANTKYVVVFRTNPDKTISNIRGINSSGYTSFYCDECGIFEDPMGLVTVEDFEPFNENRVTVNFGSAGTVYGGSFDFSTGVLTVTHACWEVDPQRYWAWNNTINGFLVQKDDVKPGQYVDDPTVLCNRLQKVATANEADALDVPSITIGGATSRVYFRNVNLVGVTDVASWRTYLTDNPITVVYRLKTPVTYNLGTVSYPTFESIGLNRWNYLWASCNGDITANLGNIEGVRERIWIKDSTMKTLDDLYYALVTVGDQTTKLGDRGNLITYELEEEEYLDSDDYSATPVDIVINDDVKYLWHNGSGNAKVSYRTVAQSS